MRRVLNWILLGGFMGLVAATALAPRVLNRVLATTGARDAMCQCTELVDNTAMLLIKTQVCGLVAGAIIFPIVAVLIRRWWLARKAEKDEEIVRRKEEKKKKAGIEDSDSEADDKSV